MPRWTSSAFLASVATYVTWFNATYRDRQLLFPLLDLLPGPPRTPDELGQITMTLLWSLTAVSVLMTILSRSKTP